MNSGICEPCSKQWVLCPTPTQRCDPTSWALTKTPKNRNGIASSVSSISHALRTAGDRRDACARHFDQPERQHQRDELLDLIALAGDLEHEALGRGVDDAGAEGVRQPQ